VEGCCVFVVGLRLCDAVCGSFAVILDWLLGVA
jgi:hypothetical protein